MTEHDMLLRMQRQFAALLRERDSAVELVAALREQVAALAEERDALKAQTVSVPKAGTIDASGITWTRAAPPAFTILEPVRDDALDDGAPLAGTSYMGPDGWVSQYAAAEDGPDPMEDV
jgi:hypothetical protein